MATARPEDGGAVGDGDGESLGGGESVGTGESVATGDNEGEGDAASVSAGLLGVLDGAAWSAQAPTRTASATRTAAKRRLPAGFGMEHEW